MRLDCWVSTILWSVSMGYARNCWLLYLIIRSMRPCSIRFVRLSYIDVRGILKRRDNSSAVSAGLPERAK